MATKKKLPVAKKSKPAAKPPVAPKKPPVAPKKAPVAPKKSKPAKAKKPPVAPKKAPVAPKKSKPAKAKKAGSPKPHLMTCACGHRGYQHNRTRAQSPCVVCDCPTFNPAERPATRTAHVPHRSNRNMSLEVATKNAILAQAALSAAIAQAHGMTANVESAEAAPTTPAKKKPAPPPPAEAPAATGVNPDELKKACKEYAGLYGRGGLEQVLKKYTTGTIADIPADKLADFFKDVS